MDKVVILFRHFFSEFFENELLPFGEEASAKFIALLSILSVISGAIAYWYNLKYILAPMLFSYFSQLPGTSWRENFVFLGLSMVIMGVVSIVLWHEMFLKRRDLENLAPLPLPSSTVFAAKVASLLVLVGFFSLSLSIFSSPFFGLGRGKLYGNSLSVFLRVSFAHAISVLSSGLFIFLFILTLSGGILLLLGQERARRFSPYFQSAILIGLISFLGIISKLAAEITPEGIGQGKLLAVPILWFTGIYEEISGINPGPFKRPALFGISSIFLLFLLFAVEYFLFQSFYLLRKEESRLRIKRERWGAVLGLIFRHPTERGIYQFMKTVISRNPRHRLVFFSYISVPVALFSLKIARLLYQGKFTDSFLFQFLHLVFLVAVIATRQLANLVYFPRGRWIFMITEGEDKKHFLSGIKKAMATFSILPVSLILFVFYSLLWAPFSALLEVSLGALSSLLVLNLSLLRYRKIPFVSFTAPGKSRLHIFWFFYLSGIYLYSYFLGWVGKMGYQKNWIFIPSFIILILLWAILELFHRRGEEFASFTYDEYLSTFLELELEKR